MAEEKRGCLAVLFGSSAKAAGPRLEGPTDRRPSPVTFPYRLKRSFLTPAEVALQQALSAGAATKYAIFPKVRVLDLCDIVDRQRNQAAFNRIDRKHLDFLLCDPATFQPIVAIELDDSTHRRADRVDRDAFVDEVLRVVGLPLVRVAAQSHYDGAELQRRIDAALTKNMPSMK